MKETNYKSFKSLRTPFLIPLIQFCKSAVHICVALLCPTIASLTSLQSLRAGFNSNEILFLYFLLFFLIDYVLYRKKATRAWRIFEWTGAIIGIVITAAIVISNDITLLEDDHVTSEVHSRWITLAEENGSKIARTKDYHSLIEPQSWGAISYLDDGGIMYVSYAECITERFAQSYRTQFLADYKDAEIQQHIDEGILYITARKQNEPTNFYSYEIAELMINEKTVIIIEAKGDYENIKPELFTPVSVRSRTLGKH